MGRGEVRCSAREGCAHIMGGQAQHLRRSVLAVQDSAPALARVDVGQKGSNGREVRGETIVHILGLPGEVLGGDDAVGAHLGEERDKRGTNGHFAAGSHGRLPQVQTCATTLLRMKGREPPQA